MREAVYVLLLLVAACSSGGAGPVSIAYDKQPCAYCRMLIGDPHFAAELVTDDGDAIDFDDPGCLMRYVAERQPHTRAIWFRDSQHDRWLAAPDARFVQVSTSPMGWGLAAVGDPGGLTYAAAVAQVAGAPRPAR